MDEVQAGPFDAIVAAYQVASATIPTSSDYSRAHRITSTYVQSLDQTRHAGAIRDAWKRFNDDYPNGDSLGSDRQTLKSIGRVLKNHGLLDTAESAS
jgi:hypothetical protein